jgi:carbamoyl-phosphate synthase small subunit
MTASINKAILMLQDGTMYEGKSFGFTGTAVGEICFNTGMTGYQEVFTDPSYYGQIVIMNNAHIGNYGVKATDVESDTVKIKGLIARNLEQQYSRLQAVDNLNNYLIENKIVAIHMVDTRALVAHVRQNGAMNCLISTDETPIDQLKAQLDAAPSMEGLELSSLVTTSAPYEIGDAQAAIKIAVMDYGVKRNILSCMFERQAHIKVFPARTPVTEVFAFGADGYFISNGPGDPAAMDYAVDTVQQLQAQGKPMFGICLGHQLIALANGAKTHKMHHGHRGLNHPVKNLITGKSEISTQNHGFAIEASSLVNNPDIEVTHVNLNDDSIEGIRLKSKPVFCVQYHPEATPGPHDSRYLFDDFLNMVKKAAGKS